MSIDAASLAAIGWKVIPEISLGPLSISPHGLGIAVGYALGGMLLARRAERLYGIKPDHVWNMLMYAVIGVIIGTRLFYVVGHLGDYFPDDPMGIFRVWEGGIVFYGGAIGGVVAAFPYARKHRLPFLKLLDAAAPGFPLGLIFGRIGDLVIGDHLGGRTSMPWGFRYEGGRLPACPPDPGCPVPIGTVFHQTALYDLVNVTILFCVVMLLARKKRPEGFLIYFTITWYGGARFFSDFARADAPKVLGLSGTQWVSVALILAGTTYLVRLVRRGVPLTSAEPHPEPEVAITGAAVGASELEGADRADAPADRADGPGPGDDAVITAGPDTGRASIVGDDAERVRDARNDEDRDGPSGAGSPS